MNELDNLLAIPQLKTTAYPWASAARQQAAEQIQLPSLKTEDWKYTRIKSVLQPQYTLAQLPAIENIAAYSLGMKNRLVFIDGFLIASLSTGQAKLLSETWLAKHFNQLADNTTPGFVAYNTAHFSAGAFIHCDSDLQALEVLVINSGQPIFTNLRHVFYVEPDCQVDIVFHYIGLDDDVHYCHNSVSEIFLAENSQLNFHKLQNEAKHGFHLDYTICQQAANSQLHHYNIDTGSQLTRNWLQSNLIGNQAAAHLYGLYNVQHHQHIDNHTRIEHRHPNTTSTELYKGLISDEAKAIFNGQVFIQQAAQQSHAEQKNINWLLSKNAEINTKPQLEIYTNDVKCSHGATIGQPDSAALFYLNSRGIPLAAAKALLIYGFAQELLQTIPQPDVRDFMMQRVSQQLPHADNMMRVT